MLKTSFAGRHGVGYWGSWSQPTCQLSIGYRTVSSGRKCDAASLLNGASRINSQVIVHHYVLVNFELDAPRRDPGCTECGRGPRSRFAMGSGRKLPTR